MSTRRRDHRRCNASLEDEDDNQVQEPANSRRRIEHGGTSAGEESEHQSEDKASESEDSDESEGSDDNSKVEDNTVNEADVEAHAEGQQHDHDVHQTWRGEFYTFW